MLTLLDIFHFFIYNKLMCLVQGAHPDSFPLPSTERHLLKDCFITLFLLKMRQISPFAFTDLFQLESFISFPSDDSLFLQRNCFTYKWCFPQAATTGGLTLQSD